MHLCRLACARTVTLVAIAVLLRGSATDAPVVPWQRVDGGFARTCTVTDTVFGADGGIYVALYEPGAVYYSADGGAAWQWLGDDMPPLVPLALLPDGQGRLWAGTVDGLYVRDDGQWQRLEGLAGSVYAIGSWAEDTLLVGAESGLFLCSAAGCRSTALTAPVLSVATGAPGAYAGTAGEGVWYAGEDGRWVRLGETTGNVNDLAVGEGGELFYVSAGALYRCPGPGHVCAVVPLPAEVSARAVAVQGDSVAVGTAGWGVLTGGPALGWTGATLAAPGCAAAGAGSAEVTSLAWKGDGGQLLAGTIGSGLFLSTDRGLTWAATEGGLGRVIVHSLARSDDGVVYAGGPSGIYSSDDAGASWRREEGACALGGVLSLATAPGAVLAGTAGGVYVNDGAQTGWTLLTGGLGRQTIFTIAVDPHDNGRFYAGCWGNNILVSADRGATWAPMHNGLETLSVHSLAVSPSRPGTMYAGTVEGVYCTNDGGASWRPCGQGMREKLTVFCLLLSSHREGLMYAGATDGLYRSEDAATGWHRVSTEMGTVYACIELDGAAPIVLCGTEQHGVWLSGDGGRTWTQWGLDGRSVYALLEASPGTVFAGTGDGLYRLDMTGL